MPRQIFSDDLEARLIELWADYQKSRSGQMVKRIVREREIAEKLNAAFRSGWLNPEKNLKLHFEQARAMQSFYASPSFATSLVRSSFSPCGDQRKRESGREHLLAKLIIIIIILCSKLPRSRADSVFYDFCARQVKAAMATAA